MRFPRNSSLWREKGLAKGKVGELGTEELLKRLGELRKELLRLRTATGRGTIGNESGKVKALRRDVARVLTVLNKRGVKV